MGERGRKMVLGTKGEIMCFKRPSERNKGNAIVNSKVKRKGKTAFYRQWDVHTESLMANKMVSSRIRM